VSYDFSFSFAKKPPMTPPRTTPINVRQPSATITNQQGNTPHTLVFRLSFQFLSFHDFSDAATVVPESAVSDGGRSLFDSWRSGDGTRVFCDSWLGVGELGTAAMAAYAFSFSFGYLE